GSHRARFGPFLAFTSVGGGSILSLVRWFFAISVFAKPCKLQFASPPKPSNSREREKEMGGTSKDLLQLETKNPSSSSLESALLVCKKDSFVSQEKKNNPDGKPITAPLPRSQVLGKVRDFLGVISEANERLQSNAKDNSENYDIEVLSGNESRVIEMDLMLGVADLHNQEAVAAAESAIAGYQPMIPLAISSSESETESEDISDEDEDNEDDNKFVEHENSEKQEKKTSSMKLNESKSAKDNALSEVKTNNKSKKRSRIVELS
ncbi:hypothetical protein UlMin_030649, partial [Ulmus minor]